MTLAYAVVRGKSPDVYAAEDIDTLHRVLALEVVAATPGRGLPSGVRQQIRRRPPGRALGRRRSGMDGGN